ncbi:hypothetical protein HF086_006115 [Spodoptera exigua]|uniref:Gamma-tubulin complex component n=1 Tax=Spodoptera exigua TaxID=7107 RepID=A0A922SNC2_SPOEX|nr:hypothetical protein HF086_006115 [Spodoptera exigua]
MIHDALLILWDCSHTTEGQKELVTYANHGDQEIFARITDIAKSHHKIQCFVEATGFYSRKSHIGLRLCGLYSQALSEGFTEVLQSYKKNLMEVEGLVIGNHNYTLSFVYSYVEKYRGLFNTLNKIITTIEHRKLIGCQILSLLHQYILNGSEKVREAILRIFSCVNKVFVNQLCTWLLYGELKDPYHEFFILNNQAQDASDTFLSSPSTTNTCDKSLVSTLQDTTLECGYALNTSMIPYFVPLSLAQEILFIGKTIILFGFDPKKVKKNSSFIASRTLLPLQNCGVESRRFTIWEDKEAEFHEKLQKLKDPEVFEVCNLRGVIREIKECVTKHLWTVAVEEAQLIHELRLMKDFYLLGRGELFLELLRLTAHMLDKPTARTSTRAARAVFLSNSADIEKFSFELPYVKPNVSANTTIDDDSATVKQLMQLLVSLRDRPCGVYLARLLMRLDYNRWLSGEAQLTQSVTNMLRY